MIRTREWLLFNAVEAWLVNYGNQPTETVQQYKKLRDELHDTFMASIQTKDAPTDDPPKRTTRKRNTSTKAV
jgi:hypothetical protein